MTCPMKVELNIETDVLTSGSIAKVITELMEFLLYQRQQIPLVYKNFKYYVEKWSELNDDSVEQASYNFQLSRQREKAKQTKLAISDMRELITRSFEENTIKKVRFLFGSTTYTPKESYTLHIPYKDVTKQHYYDHHRLSESMLCKVFFELITNNQLSAVYCSNLQPTNLFLEIETDNEQLFKIPPTGVSVFTKDATQLPRSCRNVHIHLTHKHPEEFIPGILKCCKELQIYEDGDMNKSAIETSDQNDDGAIDDTETSTASGWWEAEMFVRAFQDVPVGGKSIWNSRQMFK